MPYNIVAFETRKPGLTPEAFEDYYDNIHIPMIKEGMGSSFPLTHAWYDVKRQPETTIPLVFIGTAEDVDYDAVVLMIFQDEQHFTGFQMKYAQLDVLAMIRASGEKFTSKVVVVGLEEPHVTST